MSCSTESHSVKKNHESIASAGSIRGFFTRPRATLGKPALQNGYQSPSVIGEKTDGSNKLDALLEEYAAISRQVAEDTGTTLCDLRVAFIEHLKEHNPDNKERGIPGQAGLPFRVRSVWLSD